MDFNITQRSEIHTHMRDALINSDYDYYRSLGNTAQAIMREAIHFACMKKPLKPKIEEERFKDSDGNEVVKEWYVFKLDIYHPVLHDKITLERKLLKTKVDSW